MTDIISWSSIEGLEKAMGVPAAHAFAKRLLGFLEVKVAEIPAAFDGGDVDAIRSCVHKLASNAAALGALQLSAAARDIEALCHAGKTAEAAARKDALSDLAAQSLEILRAKLP
ncbi:MAG: Hpt domain [Alphaproteobacteria bacterium]|jgi:HPt (histidine-containing phosphotransfer) domain-containing protein|nr:Hpt domain [Alphaproteobacteria bacterium]